MRDKCYKCGGDLKVIGFTVVCVGVDWDYNEDDGEWEQIEEYGVASVVVCDNCKIGFLEPWDDDEFKSTYIEEVIEKIKEELGGYLEELPKEYTFLP